MFSLSRDSSGRRFVGARVRPLRPRVLPRGGKGIEMVGEIGFQAPSRKVAVANLG